MNDSQFLASLLVGGTIGFSLGILATLVAMILDK